jgi:hypothetical protein
MVRGSNPGGGSPDVSGSHDLVADRVAGVVEVGAQFETAVELRTLVELLPESGPADEMDMARWIRTRPERGRLSGSRVEAPNGPEITEQDRRTELGEEYFQAAVRLFERDLRSTRRWVRFVGITGSTAYGAPRPGDDCDFMAIVRPGTVWIFLTQLFLRLRLRKPLPGTPAEPDWCFNYTLDEHAALEAFSRPRGFLFAREALMVRPLQGEGYYRGLLRSGEWLKREAPRLYARWEATPALDTDGSKPTSLALRWLNRLLFPGMALYLQLKGLRANHQLTREGRADERFRTITQLDRMSLATRKFEQLAVRMKMASRLAPE